MRRYGQAASGVDQLADVAGPFERLQRLHGLGVNGLRGELADLADEIKKAEGKNKELANRLRAQQQQLEETEPDDEFVDVEAVVVFRVCNRRHHALADIPRDPLPGKLQIEKMG